MGNLIDLDTQRSPHIADDQEDDADHEDGQKDENDDCAYIVGHWAISLIWTHNSSHIADHHGGEDKDDDRPEDCTLAVGNKAGRMTMMSVLLWSIMPQDLTMVISKSSISSF